MTKAPFFVATALSFIVFSGSVFGQFGNSVNGFVFGASRQPIGEALVELSDGYSRTLGRTRTNGSGRFSFNGVPAGVLRIRVFGVPQYEEQEQEIQIQNVAVTDGRGNVRITGHDRAQVDFYLRPLRTASVMGKPATVFAQEVPDAARKKYQAGVKAVDAGRETGLEDIKGSIEMFPDYYEALERLGIEYIKRKHYMPAQLLFLRALEINPEGYKSWHGLAYARYSLGNDAEANIAVEKALTIDGRAFESILLHGILLKKVGRTVEAEAELKKADTAASGRSPETHWHLAMLYANELKRYAEAVRHLERYLKVARSSADKPAVEKLITELKSKEKQGQ